jgi:hypothetical protein
LITVFLAFLQLADTCNSISRIYKVHSSLWLALILLILLCLHRSSGIGFQRRTFPFFWVPELSLCFTHSNYLLTLTQLLLSQEEFRLSSLVEVKLRPTISGPVRHRVRQPSGTREQCFFLLEIFFRHLRVCYFVASSLTRGRVRILLLLLVLANAVPRDSSPYFIVPIF